MNEFRYSGEQTLLIGDSDCMSIVDEISLLWIPGIRPIAILPHSSCFQGK